MNLKRRNLSVTTREGRHHTYEIGETIPLPFGAGSVAVASVFED